jgi:hypothetical protein
MRIAKTLAINEKSSNASPDEKPNGSENNKSPSSSGKKPKYPFPYYGGLFSEAARRQKAVYIGKALETIVGKNKCLNFAF